MKLLSILFLYLVPSFCALSQDVLPSKKPVQLNTIKDELVDGNLQVHYIDVGDGLAMFIRTPSGKTIFVDGGNGTNDEIEKVGKYVDEFMGDNKTIDLATVTQADADHFRGMIPVFKNYRVKEFWYNGFVSQELNLERTQWIEFLLIVKKERRCK